MNNQRFYAVITNEKVFYIHLCSSYCVWLVAVYCYQIMGLQLCCDMWRCLRNILTLQDLLMYDSTKSFMQVFNLLLTFSNFNLIKSLFARPKRWQFPLLVGTSDALGFRSALTQADCTSMSHADLTKCWPKTHPFQPSCFRKITIGFDKPAQWLQIISLRLWSHP